MRWVVKAAFQKTMSLLPVSHRVNYLFQRRIARSLPSSDEEFVRKAVIAVQHFNEFSAHGNVEKEKAVFYEFGTGWDLAIPLIFYSLGIEHQILVDIRPNVRADLVEDSIAKLARHRRRLEEEADEALRPLPVPRIASLSRLKEFGIAYLAPRDARNTGLPSRSVDFVSSTMTLEHVPEPDIASILDESARLLTPGGLLSCRIDLQDHYSYVDGSVSRYNFLKFSDRTWKLVNSGVHFQNRLRYPDYVRLVKAAGLEVVSERVSRPSTRDLELLAAMKLPPEFRGRYSLEELGVKGLTIVARKPVAATNGRDV